MPNMIADIRMRCNLRKGLAVPESAVLSTGERSVVFVAKGNGIFEPREVKVGFRLRQFYEIKQGLTAGEKVVTAANFLLDSESKLRAVPINNGRRPSPQD
jgi:Cu(I)/Ag(I) efflux system membrane fusion protein